MRIAVLIIGLLVGLLLFIQSWTVGALGEFADASGTTENAGGAGLVMALGWLLASALVIPLPLASFVIFLVTVPIGLFTPTGEFGDLRFHGGVAVVLTVMSFFGWRGKRNADEEKLEERERQEARDKRLETLLVQRHAAPPAPTSSTISCPSCGHVSGPSARFCEDCGTRIMRTHEPAPTTSEAPTPSSLGEDHGRIDLEVVGPKISGRYRFVARRVDGKEIAASTVFPSGELKFKDGKRERVALGGLVQVLARKGWVATRDGDQWFEHKLQRFQR